MVAIDSAPALPSTRDAARAHAQRPNLSPPARQAAIGAAGTLVLIAACVALHPTVAPGLAQTALAPAAGHAFGTDAQGRDVASQLLAAGRAELPLAFEAALALAASGLVLAITLSSTAGLTNAAGAVLNLFASLPGLLLSVALIAVAAGSNTVVAIAVALPFIPGCWHRLLNAGCRYRAAPFTAAALAIGTPERQIDAQLAASLVAPAAAELSLLAARALAAFALLSFLGFGLPNTASIGGLIAQAPAAHAWWLAVFPAGALALICASLTLLARGLRTLGPRPSDG